MSDFFGYLRVSTARQGQGVSLAEQRDAIDQYARRNALRVVQWFEEQETAARTGRPIFASMLKLLRRRKAAGVIIHKVDRSSRNFRDWADIGDLVDFGIDVRFATEGLDLQSRGGRIAADMLAVVAADYIRNLREETKKGMRGRYKQGLYPHPAPIGYRDEGAGKPKSIDPVMGPLVKQAFELYGSGQYTLNTLSLRLKRQGLRTRTGKPIHPKDLSRLLHNPFYAGIVRIKSGNETYAGVHEPLVAMTLFERVESILDRNTPHRTTKHELLFSRLLSCSSCDRSLIGERQKRHVYYRCHTRTCPRTTIREDFAEDVFLGLLEPLQFSEKEERLLQSALDHVSLKNREARQEQTRSLQLQVSAATARLGRLTDAYLDQVLSKELFEERKTALLMERQRVSDSLRRLDDRSQSNEIRNTLDLARSAYLSYKTATTEEKRNLLRILTSNRTVDRKRPVFTLRPPFQVVAERRSISVGDPQRRRHRTLEGLVAALGNFFGEHPEWRETTLPDNPIQRP